MAFDRYAGKWECDRPGCENVNHSIEMFRRHYAVCHEGYTPPGHVTCPVCQEFFGEWEFTLHFDDEHFLGFETCDPKRAEDEIQKHLRWIDWCAQNGVEP